MKDIRNYSNHDAQPVQSASAATLPQQSVLLKNLQQIENRFQGALQFLKKTTIFQNEKKIKLNSLPWYLLVGHPSSGKTTLLANSAINFILNKKILTSEIGKISRTENCDWWVTSQSVLIDVPGNYLAYKPNMVSLPNKLWRHFLKLIQGFRGNDALSGVIVAISLSEVMNPKHRESFITMMNHRMAELRHKFGDDLPFYFVMTKADMLPGFLEFFSDYGSDELTQAWGIALPKLINGEPLSEVFVQRFNGLIKRLNKQLIWRMHQERNPFAKLYIKDFPLQVERLKESFADLLNRLSADNPSFFLKGVYFTSGTQQLAEEKKEAHPQVVVANPFQQALAIMKNPISLHGQPYFIKQFFSQALLPEKMPKLSWQHHHLFYAFMIGVLIINSVFYGNDVVSLHPSTETSYRLTQYQPDAKTMLTAMASSPNQLLQEVTYGKRD